MQRLYSAVTLLFLLVFCSATRGVAQKINVPVLDCKGNITSMSYTAPSGLTLSSAVWDFGDGFNSTGTTASHTYADTGTYTIKINATFTNSTTRTDSQKIRIAGLPVIGFYYKASSSDTCFNHNIVCFVDTTKPASAGQTLFKRSIVWGDGTFTNAFPPKFGDEICHNYAVSDKYTIQMEITDNYGCKNSIYTSKEVVDNIELKFTIENEFVDCETKKVCLLNMSQGKTGSAKFKWKVDTSAIDTNKFFSSKKCIYYKGSRPDVFVDLMVEAANGCKDTLQDTFNVKLEPMPTAITMEDRKLCFTFDGSSGVSIPALTVDQLIWSFSGNQFPPPPPHSNAIGFSPSIVGALPGLNTVKVTITRGSCVRSLTDTFRVMGPMPSFKIIDEFQCFSNRPIYFYNSSRFSYPETARYRWTISDPNGDNCTKHVVKNINAGKNCNVSLDWWIKHKFKVPGAYGLKFWVKDTVNGCEGEVEGKIDLKYCSPILKLDSVGICEDRNFLENSSPPFPKYFQVDSSKRWQTFPDYVDSGLIGKHDLGMIFETLVSPWAETIGNDSIRIHQDSVFYYDTVYRKKFLDIYPLKRDSMYIKIYGDCKPFRATLYLKGGSFKPGETIMINWGDSGNVIRKFTTFSQVDSIVHIYNKSGVYSNVRIVLVNGQGCENAYLFDVRTGHTYSSINAKYDCIQNRVCFSPFVFDLRNNIYWPNNTPRQYVKWELDDTAGQITDFVTCYKFKKGGKQAFKMILQDSFGCKDTLRDTVFIQDLRANVRHSSRKLYCSELKQFFDSSYSVSDSSDKIVYYAWDFGTGVYSTFQKNPLQAFNTSVEKLNVRHVVTTVQGCTDTIRYTLDIIGPKPYFTIDDTVGCGSLLARFNNLSRNCKSYIWEFGDSLNSTQGLNDHQFTQFNYTKPGRYKIKLTGFDTVYNPFTQSTVYCKNTFPDNTFQKDSVRAVIVLPIKSTGIQGPDTLCIGEGAVFTSLSDTAYVTDYWNMGDGNKYTRNAPSSITHAYSSAGNYKIKLNPLYNNSLNDQCLDSASKDVVVMSITADFDIDPSSKPPQFNFNNKSLPAGLKLFWDFGQPSSGSSNFSNDEKPGHFYGNDTGTYNVCLRVVNEAGCADTICKPVLNDQLPSFELYNVFTPGTIDGKNDVYDVQIDGEDTYHLQIYNRWGILVFEGKEDGNSNDNKNWNGRVNNTGEECPSGTYYYIFKYSLKTKPEEIKQVTGTVLLIR